MNFLKQSKGIFKSFALFYFLNWLFLSGIKIYGYALSQQILLYIFLLIIGIAIVLAGVALPKRQKRKGGDT